MRLCPRDGDAFQLAHYYRMLEATGHAATLSLGGSAVVGGIIGKDTGGSSSGLPLVAWHRGAEVLDAYDQEFDERVEFARGADAGESEAVRAFHIAECAGCEWRTYCTGGGSPHWSFSLKVGLLERSEYRMLQDAGLDSIANVAETGPESLVAVGLRAHGDRIASFVRRARMVRDGVPFEVKDPTSGWPEVPHADVEIDFDLEWDTETDLDFMWGIRVQDSSHDPAVRWETVYDFSVCDEDGARRLARRAQSTIESILESARQSGRSVKVFHWSHPESSRTRKKYPEFHAVVFAPGGQAVDLRSWTESNFFFRDGYSIKSVAPSFGFEWSVEEPGGDRATKLRRIAASGGPESAAAKRWLIKYNASDVEAQAAIRDGLRSHGRAEDETIVRQPRR